MPNNIVELIAGPGIDIETDINADTIKLINSSALSEHQKAALENDKANANNKYLTSNEIDEKINITLDGSNMPPKDFPKFFTSSGNYTIPKTGRYRITAVGGGGGGATCARRTGSGNNTEYDVNGHQDGGKGSNTKVEVNDQTKCIATGGRGGLFTNKPMQTYNQNFNYYFPNKIYDGKDGSVIGSWSYHIDTSIYFLNLSQIADNGRGIGGGYVGGGAGSPLYYKQFDQIAGNGYIEINGKKVYNISNDGTYPDQIFRKNGMPGTGYGAGGGTYINARNLNLNGIWYNIDLYQNKVHGACSGCLSTIELNLNINDVMKITIGAGGSGHREITTHTVTTGTSSNGVQAIIKAGDGAQGAVLLEWISA